VALVIDKNFDFALLHHTDAGVRSSEIDTDNYIAELLADAPKLRRCAVPLTSAIAFL
jgi:hypothetical protein